MLTAAGDRLEYREIAPARDAVPTLVFLHEGLGSLAQWRDFPDRLAAATGCGALVYSRRGYGRSAPLGGPRGRDYLHREALTVLPEVLSDRGLAAPVLIGHSDGASIALIHAGAGRWPVRGVVVEAPHVFVEDVTVAGLVETRAAWRDTDLRQRLGRHHDDVDGAFLGWNDTWLDPAFRGWNIEEFLPAIACPVLAIQGAEDGYGTLAQLDAIARRAAGPVETLVLPGCGHTPHRERRDAVLDAMARFIAAL